MGRVGSRGQGEDTQHYRTLNIKDVGQRHIKHLKISPKAKKIFVRTLKHLRRQKAQHIKTFKYQPKPHQKH